jgi:hypothetical protein
MLGVLTDPTQSYRNFASSYFGVDPDPEAVTHIFNLRPLTLEVVQRINVHATLDETWPLHHGFRLPHRMTRAATTHSRSGSAGWEPGRGEKGA